MEARRLLLSTWATREAIAASTEAAGAKMEAMEALEADGGGAVTTRRVTQVAAVLVVRWGLAIGQHGGKATVMEALCGACSPRELWYKRHIK